MTSQAADLPMDRDGTRISAGWVWELMQMIHATSLLKLRRKQSPTEKCLVKHCDGGKHVVLFYMWWSGDLAYPGAPEVHTEGKWHHFQRVGGPATIRTELGLHLETATDPDRGDGVTFNQ